MQITPEKKRNNLPFFSSFSFILGFSISVFFFWETFSDNDDTLSQEQIPLSHQQFSCLRSRFAISLDHDGCEHLVPFQCIFFPSVCFNNDEKSSNVSRAYPSNSGRLPDSFWADLQGQFPITITYCSSSDINLRVQYFKNTLRTTNQD